MHRLVTGRAHSNRHCFRRFRPGEHCRYPICNLHPAECRVSHFRTCPAAMQHFAEEPFARIHPSAFGDEMRTDFPRKFRYFTRFLYTCMVLPKPRHCIGIAGKFLLKREWMSFFIDRKRSTSRRIHTNPKNIMRLESTNSPFGLSESLFDAEFRPFHIVGGMLAGKIGIMRKNHAAPASLIVPHRRPDLPAVCDVDHKSPDRIRSEIKSNRISFFHIWLAVPFIL